MPTTQVRIGVPQIFLSVDSTTAVPSLNVTESAGFTFIVCDVTPDEYLINDPNQPLLAADTYQVILGLVGRRFS